MHKRKRSGGKGLPWKLFIQVIVILAMIMLISTGMLTLRQNQTIKTKTTAIGLQDVGKLITQSAYFTEVNMVKDAAKVFNWEVPFTQSKYIYSYDGTVDASYDFTKIIVEPDESSKIIRVTLPKPEELEVKIDESSLEIYDETQNIFTPLSLEALSTAKQEMEDKAKNDAIEHGIMDKAEGNAKALLNAMLASIYDMNEYTVEYAFEE